MTTTLSATTEYLKAYGQDPQLLRKSARWVRSHLSSEQAATGLRRDLTVPHEAPRAMVDLVVRPIRDEDLPHLLETDRADLTTEERRDRLFRQRILDGGFGTCYVAVDPDGVATYMQWLCTPVDNDAVQRHFKGAFPVLREDEVLLEGAFTPEAARGKRIMSAAMSMIAEKGLDTGARTAITFVGDVNAASLKGCARAGFTPYLRRTRRWRLFRQTIEFGQL